MNSGVGIEAKHLGPIFKDFEQLDAGTSRHYEGTGLDLA
jgi:signal transduction histidine kinase